MAVPRLNFPNSNEYFFVLYLENAGIVIARRPPPSESYPGRRDANSFMSLTLKASESTVLEQ